MGNFGKPWAHGAYGTGSSNGNVTDKRSVKDNVRVKNATVCVHPDGTKFRSKLELYFYSQLLLLGVPFERQHRIILRPLFPDPGGFSKTKNIASWNWYADFYFPWCGMLIDTKGWTTEVAKIKIELVLYRIHTGELDYAGLDLISTKSLCQSKALHMKFLYQTYLKGL